MKTILFLFYHWLTFRVVTNDTAINTLVHVFQCTYSSFLWDLYLGVGILNHRIYRYSPLFIIENYLWVWLYQLAFPSPVHRCSTPKLFNLSHSAGWSSCAFSWCLGKVSPFSVCYPFAYFLINCSIFCQFLFSGLNLFLIFLRDYLYYISDLSTANSSKRLLEQFDDQAKPSLLNFSSNGEHRFDSLKFLKGEGRSGCPWDFIPGIK